MLAYYSELYIKLYTVLNDFYSLNIDLIIKVYIYLNSCFLIKLIIKYIDLLKNLL